MCLLVIGDFLLQIAAISILHNDAEKVKGLIVKGLFVADYVFGLDWGEDSDFVKSIDFLFLLEFLDFNFL